jgi:tetratricopeptide (TPR) repeat protein
VSLPSGLPLANDVKKSVLKALLLGHEPLSLAFRLLESTSHFPFEGFMDVVLRNLCSIANRNIELPSRANDLAAVEGSRLNTLYSQFFNIYRAAKPSITHAFIAQLIKRKQLGLCVTTNFDTLFEQAFSQEDVTGVQVLSSEPEFTRERFDLVSTPKLIKIHGSITDISTIRTTLDGVADPSLGTAREKVVQHLFGPSAHQSVLILGYSCSDVFDISPSIVSAPGNRRRVVLVDHKKGVLLSDAAVTEIKQRQPFGNYEGHSISCDTAEAIRKLSFDLGIAFSDTEEITPAYSLALVEVAPMVDKLFALTALCLCCGDIHYGTYFAQKTVAVAANNREKLANAYCNLSTAYLQQNNIAEAWRAANMAEKYGADEVSCNKSILSMLRNGHKGAKKGFTKSVPHSMDVSQRINTRTSNAYLALVAGDFVSAKKNAASALDDLRQTPATPQFMGLGIQCLLYLAQSNAALGDLQSIEQLAEAERKALLLQNTLFIDQVRVMRWKICGFLGLFEKMDEAMNAIINLSSIEFLRRLALDAHPSGHGISPTPAGWSLSKEEAIEILQSTHCAALEQLKEQRCRQK